jgi:hypothetical protein
VGDDAQYEFKSVQAIRGTGAKTIAKWQKAGWELDTQRQGVLRTEMTFRRVKPKDPWQQLAAFIAKSWAAFHRLKPKTQQLLLAASGGLVLLAVIVVGAATGSPTATDAASSESQEQKPELAMDEEAAIAAAEKALAADQEVVVPNGAGAAGQLPDAAAEQAELPQRLPAPPPPVSTPAPTPSRAPAPGPVPAPAPRAPAPAPAPAPGAFYQNCDAVRAAGAAPILPGDPGWQQKFDGDGDGIGCDR